MTSQLCVSSIDYLLGKQIADRRSFLDASQEQQPITHHSFARRSTLFPAAIRPICLPQKPVWVSSGFDYRPQRVVDRLR
jgi:hypothetical protein